MKSTREKENNRCITLQMHNLHQRLHHALNLGTRYFDEKTNKWRWKCANIEVQKQVLRSIDAFLDSLSGDAQASHHTIVKDSIDDVLGALLWILQGKNGLLLSMAANSAVKLVGTLPNSVWQSHIFDLIHPLSTLLSSHQTEVAVACSTALNLVISNLSVTSEKAVWEALNGAECVLCIVGNINNFNRGVKKIEYFEEVASLLSTILWRWPPSRFPVWNDDKLIKALVDMHIKTDFSTRLAVLKLYKSLALCGTVAKRLIEDGEVFLRMVVQSMAKSHPHVIRLEGFRLAQCLLASQENCLKVMDFCGEALVEAIICGMGEMRHNSRKPAKIRIALLVEACQLALVTRWAEQISLVKEGLKANYLLSVRGYVWDILGWIAIHCEENFNPIKHGSELRINLLITCACLTFVDEIEKWCRICQKDVGDNFTSEPASRAVLMMIYSPCNYIASQARFILSEILKGKGITYLKNLIHTLDYASSLVSYGSFDKLQLAINLNGLTCFSSLPEYQRCIAESKGLKVVLIIVQRCLSNEIHVERFSFAPHLHTNFLGRTCCWVCSDDWEGSNILLFYGLWGLAEVTHQCGSLQDNPSIFTQEIASIEAQLVSKFHEICSSTTFSPGLRWYATYILSYFGFYGFPNELAQKIGKSLNEKEYADMQLIVANGDSLSVHGVLLAVRCPSLLPPEGLPVIGKRNDGLSSRELTNKYSRETMREVRLSVHVDYEALVKLLEYIYLGCLHADEETVKKLKVLAKRCNLRPLLRTLYKKSPKWGMSFPSLDLASCLGSAGSCFSDVMLEANTDKLIGWTCNICSHSLPHFHAHKVILQSGCDYFRALFHSGMQESHSQIIKVDISWEAMVILVHWFYSNELPNPPSGCLWDNMDNEKKLSKLQAYVELCWLAEFWVWENIQEPCWNVIMSCLDSAKHLSVKIIKIAANYSLWKLVDVAANYLAPSYCQLRDSGELEELDDMLVHLIYSASLRLAKKAEIAFR
ncbi:hypothetical protein L6164_018174 [Bauhinia variegata]|uniref:Uncharacterized protein n=1 Tax=Bauhinia variegata TaxID=167791 RepID=A0ACB9NBD3_BAUVA|nr:hypothetical protein L6164_018174 [Bauhinia variegata]